MYELIASNKRRSILLVGAFVLVVSLVGAAFGIVFGYGWQGTVIALVVSGALAFASYWKADAVARSSLPRIPIPATARPR